ncbi:hypothetical protein [Gynurincola endophyticus]|uniref:hypothetical protein n=1 Tax=Gynurincola endophyticus TaxID=2479004 RepID=UPI000F8C40F3|nr:hypothetical protein [Gynurincola endophyticus]
MKRREFGRNLFLVGAGLPIVSKISSSSAAINNRSLSVEDGAEAIPVDQQFKYNTQPVFVITKGDQSEVVVFDANLNFQTENVRKATTGLKITKIDRISWEGKSFSKLLNQDIYFRVSKVRKASLNSLRLNANFPANLEMAFDYEILDQNRKVIESDIAARLSSDVASFKTFFPKKMTVQGNISAKHTNHQIGFNFCGA